MSKRPQKEYGVWTLIPWKERTALKLLCVKRTMTTGKRVTVRSLLRKLIREELMSSFRKGELNLEELEMTIEDFAE